LLIIFTSNCSALEGGDFLPDNRLTFIDFFRLAHAMGGQGKTLSKRRDKTLGGASPTFI
jgi:hypothetical protein